MDGLNIPKQSGPYIHTHHDLAASASVGSMLASPGQAIPIPQQHYIQLPLPSAARAEVAHHLEHRGISGYESHDPHLLTVQPNDIQNLTGAMIDEKVAIYRHPLFPLLRILFEKTELATNSIESTNSTKFDQEIKTFITRMARENKPFFTEDAEVDGLVIVYFVDL